MSLEFAVIMSGITSVASFGSQRQTGKQALTTQEAEQQESSQEETF